MAGDLRMLPSQADSTNHSQGSCLPDDEFVHLFVQHQRALFLYARTLLGDVAATEEVMQETSMVLWHKRHQFVPGSSFVNWAMTVAQFQVLKYRQRHKHTPRAIDEELLGQLATDMVAYYDLFDARQRALGQCLDALNSHDRNLVNAAYSVDATKKDVSRLVGMTPNGLYKALNRIRQRLHRCIQHRLTAEGLA
jgi:RNA polymerase sigma-70 factor, ECF subfamily